MASRSPAAALGNELAQSGSERITRHEDDSHTASRPAPLDLLVERSAVEIRHADIRQDHIVVFDGHVLERFATGSDGHHAVLRGNQAVGKRLANLLLASMTRIVRRDGSAFEGNEDSTALASTAPRGSVIENSAPPCAAQATVNVPSWASTMPRLTARPTPSPIPVGLVVK